MIRKILFLSILLFPFFGYSQTKVADLVQAYKSEEHLDSVFYLFYNHNSDINWFDFVDQTAKYFTNGSERIDFLTEVTRQLDMKSPQASSTITNRCIELAKLENDPGLLASAYAQNSYVLIYSGKYTEAVKNLSYALSLINKLDHPEVYAGILADLAQAYQAMGDYENAEKYFLNSSEL